MTPVRGEIWKIKADKDRTGSEYYKTRPYIIISSDNIDDPLGIKLAVPLTEWKDSFEKYLWKIRIEPSIENGLEKISAIDVLQTRGIDKTRIVSKLGNASTKDMEDIVVTMNTIIDSELISTPL